MNIVLQNVVSQIVNKNIGKNDSEILEDILHTYTIAIYIYFMPMNCCYISVYHVRQIL